MDNNIIREEIEKYTRKCKLMGIEPLQIECKTDKVIINDTIENEVEKIVIPKFVTSVGADAFSNLLKLKEIDLANVEEVGEKAFNMCLNLDTVKMSKSCKVIKIGAFMLCEQLREIDLSEVEVIEESAFYHCGRLEQVKLGANLKKIGSRAFKDCKELNDIELPEGLESIGIDVFDGCNKITKIRIPKSVKEIHKHSFNGCDNLVILEVPRELKVNLLTKNFSCRLVFY